ncbi:MAG: FtsQ-type POTRA domain-containing protein [Clostridia bacterium]|nr:FtsQ-type POTRA domain-containing protein [Clostridia bacterium]
MVRRPWRRARRAGLRLLLAGAVLTALVLVLRSDLFRVDAVRITGLVRLDAATVRAAAGLQGPQLIWSLRPGTIRARVERLPRVAAAAVRMSLPRHLTIDVRERVPVAILVASAVGGNAAYLEVDGEGRVLGAAPDGFPPDEPLLTLAERPAVPAEGTVLDDVCLRRAVAFASVLGSHRQEVAELHCDASGELRGYTADGLPVYLGVGGGDVNALATAFLGVLTDIRANGRPVAVIDLRSPERPVVRLREWRE